MKNNILEKIEKAGLVGRGGAGFPTHRKWQFLKDTKGDKKYVICNASEGELGLFKDIYILEHHLDRIFLGMKIAMDFLNTKEAYINLNINYYFQIEEKIENLVREYEAKGYHIRIFKERPSYSGGEETALLNAIEGQPVQPRLKPPYPSEKGLFGCPTLVHNVETLFNVAAVVDGTFEHKRFYCISGPIKNKGVYHLPDDWSIDRILKETDNIPEFDYFAQIGGSASGMVFNAQQLKKEKVTGAGSIELYRASLHPQDVLLKWFSFYNKESCGKCTPCREGTYQLYKLVSANHEIPWKKILDILDTLEDSSFCALGTSVPIPVRSYMKNVLKKKI
jgi:NADH:ubiquinone oxidoreductase subunit F (NADH-binding)